MISTHQIIKTDLYDIASRIKEIDSSYFIALNYKTKKFELHAANARGSSLCLVLPYNRLDERTITHARRTRAERAVKLLQEAEKENARLERKERERIIQCTAHNA